MDGGFLAPSGHEVGDTEKSQDTCFDLLIMSKLYICYTAELIYGGQRPHLELAHYME